MWFKCKESLFVTNVSFMSSWDHFSSCPAATLFMFPQAFTVPPFQSCDKNSFKKPFLTTKNLGLKPDCWGSNPSSTAFQLCDLDSVPQFLHPENEDGAIAPLRDLLWGWNEGTHIKQLDSAWHIINTQQSLDIIIVTTSSSFSFYDSQSHLLHKAYLTPRAHSDFLFLWSHEKLYNFTSQSLFI